MAKWTNLKVWRGLQMDNVSYVGAELSNMCSASPKSSINSKHNHYFHSIEHTCISIASSKFIICQAHFRFFLRV
jgi:hypothetical protein